LITTENQVIQSLTADSLFFHNEAQLHDFLVAHHLAKDYQITLPKMYSDCTQLPDDAIYPGMESDDYLHEERFTGKPFIVLYNHIITRKHLVNFFPTYYKNNPGAPHNLDFCGVNDYITNPKTGQVACFIDSFNWMDENGENIFNTNKKLWLLWGFNDTTVIFPTTRIHTPTGLDYSFDAYFPGHDDLMVSFDSISTVYNYLK
jgi:hypothetical protein